MKTNNYYLREIAKNTGSEISTMKNDVFYLRDIASNVGATVTGNVKNRNTYLKIIAEHTENYQSLDDYIALICNEDIVQKDSIVGCKARVIIDGEVAVGETVNFYVEE